jgi:hypothetical protein
MDVLMVKVEDVHDVAYRLDNFDNRRTHVRSGARRVQCSATSVGI